MLGKTGINVSLINTDERLPREFRAISPTRPSGLHLAP